MDPRTRLSPDSSSTARTRRRELLAASLLAACVVALPLVVSAAEQAHAVPAFAASSSASTAESEVAVLAGGCFWGVQGVFQHLKGVSNAVSGYAGGSKTTASYMAVGSGMTGHAESVQVTFDPRQISYAQILQVYFSVAHDPTQLNRQGPDVGSQYRSVIFPMSEEQSRIAKAYIAQIEQTHVFGSSAIATRVEPGKEFYPAEGYHQDYLVHNPTQPYIVINDLPKIEQLKRMYPQLYREQPVLVANARKPAP